MIEFYVKENNIKKPIEDSDTSRISENFINLINNLFEGLGKDIEVNIIPAGTLGNEMLNDPRFNKVRVNLELKRLNQEVGGKSIKEGSDYLLDEYKSENLCFICNVGLTGTLHTIFHELYHFKDPFTEKINYTKQLDEGIYIDTKKFVQNSVQNMLNEFHSEFRSIKVIFSLKKEKALKRLDLISLIEIYINLVNELDNTFKLKLNSIKNFDINSFNCQIEMLDFAFNKFFKYFFGYLGMWRGIYESGYRIQYILKIWDELIQKIKINNDDKLGEFLDYLKNEIIKNFDIDLFENNDIIIDSLMKSFIEYFFKDFRKLISQLKARK
ncbi:hypothetical protein LCGC14_1456640 [marine sediment metagenome]|uniref:Uncharacterized protein n=1 Tax=marine sediment metagenome TaxID=412755 RepID=A0A0F9K2G7_9ZZZZ